MSIRRPSRIQSTKSSRRYGHALPLSSKLDRSVLTACRAQMLHKRPIALQPAIATAVYRQDPLHSYLTTVYSKVPQAVQVCSPEAERSEPPAARCACARY